MTLNYFMKILDKNNLLAPKNGYFRILFLWEETGGGDNCTEYKPMDL